MIDYDKISNNEGKVNRTHVVLGLQQLVKKPWLFLTSAPLFAAMWFALHIITDNEIWEKICSLLPNELAYVGYAIEVLLYLVIFILSISIVGELTAKKPEEQIKKAFDNYERRNGNPILRKKSFDKHTKIITTEWYSPIPLSTFNHRIGDVEYQLNITVIKTQYGKKPNTIIIEYYKGRPRDRGEIHDDTY